MCLRKEAKESNQQRLKILPPQKKASKLFKDPGALCRINHLQYGRGGGGMCGGTQRLNLSKSNSTPDSSMMSLGQSRQETTPVRLG